MSAPNFCTMKNFNLFVQSFEPISMEDYQKEEFPYNDYYYDDYENAETEEEKAEILEKAYNDTMQFWNDIFYQDIFDGADGFKHEMEKFNYSLTFHRMELKSGYYDGVQIYVEELAEMPHILDNEDCRYYYDMCRSQAIRKYEAEVNKINKWMEKVATQYGWRKLHCLGVFSNGEAIYQYA